MKSTGNTRPDPDALLAQMRVSDHAARRGKLRIYFGASAGVGKTFAMLSAAQQAVHNGQDVLVGLVETHGRPETLALLHGLQVLPLRSLPHRKQTLQEFDLDAALSAHPAILLVDELAHSNAPGSRHPKRWQDIEELLDAGIEVWTALNVQHLESLNGTIGTITGVRIHETVPDTVLYSADEIILVDVTADELLARLQAGKVYIPQQAQQASQNFFRKGNLIALREIALRRTAEHMGDDVLTYRLRHLQKARDSNAIGTPAWNTSGTILVCVGPNAGAEQAVRSAARLAGQLNVRWYAAYVETPTLQRRPALHRDRTLTVLKLAEELGARTAMLPDEKIAQALVIHAQALNCATLVVGRPQAKPWGPLWRLFQPTLTRQLASLAPSMDLVEVGTTESMRKLPNALVREVQDKTPNATWAAQWQRYLGAWAACVLTTLLAFGLERVFDPSNIVMLFLLGVVCVAVRFGRGPSTLAALLSVVSFDFFFVPPRFSFSVGDTQYLMTFGIMLLVGLLIGQLTANLRFAAQVSGQRERRAQALFELARELSAALLCGQVIQSAETLVQRTFGGETRVLMPDANDQLLRHEGLPPTLDIGVADWAFRNGQSAGVGTATLPGSAWHFVPLRAPMRIRGVLALCPTSTQWLLIPEEIEQLDTFARQIAIALERVHYVDVAQSAVLEMESERLRNTLLAAMSHDVRSPLTALVGQAELLGASSPLTPAQKSAAQSIGQEARELSTLVTNMLEMARLQSGQVELRKAWQSVEEVLGSAIRSARHALGSRVVRSELPADLPLVEFDAGLVERLLVNLLENAAKYSSHDPDPDATAATCTAANTTNAAPTVQTANPAIVVTASTTAHTLVIKVRDFGPGLPHSVKGKEQALFTKFTRGQPESATRGVGLGLGLAICKAIADAHHGSITAAQALGGGAEFTLTLPRTAPPAIPDTPAPHTREAHSAL